VPTIIKKNYYVTRFITGFVTIATRRVPLLEQELPTLPVHLSSLPIFSEVRVAQSLVFFALFCRSLFAVFFPLFLLVIALTVLLRFRTSNYLFD